MKKRLPTFILLLLTTAFIACDQARFDSLQSDHTPAISGQTDATDDSTTVTPTEETPATTKKPMAMVPFAPYAKGSCPEDLKEIPQVEDWCKTGYRACPPGMKIMPAKMGKKKIEQQP